MLYSYKAKDEAGKTVTGHIEGNSELVVASQLRDMGYFPLRVAAPQTVAGRRRSSDALAGVSTTAQGDISIWQPQEHWLLRRGVYPLWTGVSMPDLAFFFRQLAALLTAGVPVYRSLETIQEQLRSGVLKRTIQQISNHVQAGGTITDAMAQFPYLFNDFQLAMIRVGEMTGELGIMLTRVSDYLEREYALRQMIKRETFYPKMVLVLTFLLPPLYLFFVNQGATYFQTAVAPLLEIFGGIGIGYVLGRYLLRSGTLRLMYDTVKAYLPYFGSTVRMLALAKFCRALAALYSAGVTVPIGLRAASKVAGNSYLSYGIDHATEQLVAGASISQAFAAAKVFPQMVVSLVGTGETTGSLDAMLDKAADYYEGESAVRLQKSATSLGVVVLLIAAVVVGFVVFHFYGHYAGQLANIMNDQ